MICKKLRASWHGMKGYFGDLKRSKYCKVLIINLFHYPAGHSRTANFVIFFKRRTSVKSEFRNLTPWFLVVMFTNVQMNFNHQSKILGHLYLTDPVRKLVTDA